MEIDNATIMQMQSDIRRILSILDNGGGSQRGGLVLGQFLPGEQILMKDKRLYEGSAAPFRNSQEVWRAKRKGCPFHTPDSQRRWSIKAEDLEAWLNGTYVMPLQ